MIVTYTPEDGNPSQTWGFDPTRVRVSEQVIVEKQFGDTWQRFVAGCKANEAAARRILLCHLIRRDHPAHQLRDTPDFMDCELVIEMSLAELEENYEAWISAGGGDEEHGDLLRSMFSAEIEKAREREGGAPGKAPSKNAPKGTSGS